MEAARRAHLALDQLHDAIRRVWSGWHRSVSTQSVVHSCRRVVDWNLADRQGTPPEEHWLAGLAFGNAGTRRCAAYSAIARRRAMAVGWYGRRTADVGTHRSLDSPVHGVSARSINRQGLARGLERVCHCCRTNPGRSGTGCLCHFDSVRGDSVGDNPGWSIGDRHLHALPTGASAYVVASA